MAGRANKDVTMVIRARDEAQRTIDSVSSALAKLLGIQGDVADGAKDTSSGISQLATVLGTLEKAYTRIDGAANQAAAAFERQQASLKNNRAELTALQAQAAGAARAVAQLKTAIVDTRLDGGDTSTLVAQLAAAEREITALAKREVQFAGNIRASEAAIDGQASSMQRLGSFAIAAADGLQRAEAATRKQAQAIEQQAKASALLQRINDSTGVSRIGQAEGSAERSAEILFAAHEKGVKEAAAAERVFRAEVKATGQALRDRIDLLTRANSGKSASESASVFAAEDVNVAKQAAAAEIELIDAAARLRATIDPLGAIQAKLNQELRDAQRLYKAGSLSATELAQAERVLTATANEAAAALNRQGRGDRGKPSLFGLKPYELTNLSYQVNDVFTQLASGSGVLQTMAQQGGQIIQILPQLGTRLAGALTNPAVLAAGASIGAIAIAINKAADDASRLREFEGALNASAEGANYQAQELAGAAEQLDKYGAAAEAANNAVRAFVTEGVDPSRINDFAKGAQDLSDVLGIDLPEATRLLSQGLTGGYDDIRRLDDATNAFTNSEMEMIRALFEEGKAQEARSRAAEIAFRRLDEGADKARGKWTDSIRSLGSAWEEFKGFLADSAPLQGAFKQLNDLADLANEVAKSLRSAQTATEAMDRIMDLRRRIAIAERATSPDIFGQRAANIAAMRKELEQLGPLYDRLALRERAADTITQEAAARERAGRLADIQAKKDEDRLDSLTGRERVRHAGELAFQAEMRASGDAIIAQAQRELAVQKEQEKVDKERVTAARERERLREAAINDFAKAVIGPESGGNSSATNSRSSAVGLGQFLDETWVNLFRNYFPDRAAKMGEAAILELRKDAKISKDMIVIYARENAKLIEKAGESVTKASLYLTHFLGGPDAKKIMDASPSTPVDRLLSRQVMAANPEYLRVDRGKGRARTAAELRQFLGEKIGESSTAQGQVTTRLNELEDQRLDKQRRFTEQVTAENIERQRTTVALKQQEGLTGVALIQKERQATIDAEILKKQQEIDKINSELVANGQERIAMSDAERRAIERTVGAQYDLNRAKDLVGAQRDAVMQPVQDLTEQRDVIQEQIRFLMEMGQSGLADGLQPQLDAVNAKLREAIDAALKWWESIAGDPTALANLTMTGQQLQNMIGKLTTAKLGAQDLGRTFGIANAEIADQLTNGLTNAFDNFIQRVGEGKNVFESLLVAFGQFAADFLRQIAQMIAKQLIFNAIKSAMATAGGILHSGGIAGSHNRTRMVNPAVFTNAARFHTGGVAGLRPDEVPAILQRGEEVITKSDMRHRNNGGTRKGGAERPPRGLKQVLVQDPRQIAAAMQSSAGDEVFITFLSNNRETVKQIINDR